MTNVHSCSKILGCLIFLVKDFSEMEHSLRIPNIIQSYIYKL